MQDMSELAAALAGAIPGYSGAPQPPPAGADAADWLAETLGEDFCCYVEWKEFDTWGVEALAKLVPLARSGVALSLDSLYDDDGAPIAPDDADAFEFELIGPGGDFFLPTVNDQLRAAGLGVVEICSRIGDALHAAENPVLVCIAADEAAHARLNAALRGFGLTLA